MSPHLSVDLFLANYRPAVDVGLSVTRVGSAAQTSSMKQVGGAFKIDMAQYFELQAFSQFAADIGPETQVRLARSFTSCWQHSVDTTASADTLPVESGLFRRDVDSTAEKAVWSRLAFGAFILSRHLLALRAVGIWHDVLSRSLHWCIDLHLAWCVLLRSRDRQDQLRLARGVRLITLLTRHQQKQA